MPDTFFRNEKEAKFHDIIQPNLYVRVFPNGDVLYSIRVRKLNNISIIITSHRPGPFASITLPHKSYLID